MRKDRVKCATSFSLLIYVFATATWSTELAAQPVAASALVRRPLAADTVIGGIPCARTGRAQAEFHKESGRLAGCFLSREFEEAGHRFGTGTWLDRNASGVLWGAWLAQPTLLDGHTCFGKGYKAWSTRFYPSGRLESCYLTRDTVVEGIPCMHGTFWREIRGGSKTTLYLHPNGRMRQCQAARDTVVGGQAVRRWQVIRKDSSGAVVASTKARDL
jgi:hypothetical protein